MRERESQPNPTGGNSKSKAELRFTYQTVPVLMKLLEIF